MIEVKDIIKSYDGLRVLDEASLTINDGEFLSIVGPSGAGKTTLLQIIGSLETPDSGKVIYDGTDIVKMKEAQLAAFRNRNMGFVFQFHQLLPEFSMAENVAMPAMIGGMGRKEAMERAAELLDGLGLGGRLTHRPNQLSGGERQRAAVARALINDPKVILADEPSGSLDSHNREELYRLFFDLRSTTGKTFIIVTHDESLACNSDRVIHMADGRIIDDIHSI
ncbi:ABC transporter ATP-binding protein [Duncaniella freteri]|jgi:lipoprotein-releasing system ATP-binding protein|uniref:ABC transporter ATP-binding protein n=3 Tax=Duncaniella TaxID=2518495 RepID=A0A4Z0V8B6_9BACT|nr:ABC transporter ATP-binding protein [Duncaniella freteri]MDE7028180.1 ABC transporter ATP-binding protein [Duncaniella freteri]TGG40437.1 ABC transporter ATP-binding protein [Duncaniella freteri]